MLSLVLPKSKFINFAIKKAIPTAHGIPCRPIICLTHIPSLRITFPKSIIYYLKYGH